MSNNIRALAISLIAFLLSIQSSLADTVVPSDRVVNSLIVRSAPSANSDPVGKLYPGQPAEYIESVPHWYQVRLSNNTEGYVHKSWSKILTSQQGSLDIHFIDVGQGDSTLVICPNGESLLVDVGSSAHAEQDSIRDYILNIIDRNQRNIDTLVITHPDIDHYNLIPGVLSGVPVDQIFMVGQADDYNASFSDWLEAQSNNNKTVLNSDYFDRKGSPNSGIDCGDADVYILAAAIDSSFSRKNTMSIVLMIRYGDFEVMLTGDATKKTEEVIVNRYENDWLDVDVLKIGHHGSSATSTTEDWADIVRPEVAVASSGARNSHGHPRQVVIERLDDYTTNNAPQHNISSSTGKRGSYTWHDVENYTESIYVTATNGNVVVTSDGEGYSVSTSHHEE